jgi:hypothetical protein
LIHVAIIGLVIYLCTYTSISTPHRHTNNINYENKTVAVPAVPAVPAAAAATNKQTNKNEKQNDQTNSQLENTQQK